MAVTIRPASPADIPELVRLEQACFSLPHTEEQFLHELQDDVYALFVASDGDAILGYAGLTHILDEGYITRRKLSNISEIITRAKMLRSQKG